MHATSSSATAASAIFGTPLPSPACPPLLAAVLNTTRKWESNHDDMYFNFLRQSRDLVRECDEAGIQIQTSFKLRAPGEDESDNMSCGSNASHGLKKENNAVSIIFKFYCRIDNDVNMTFDQLKEKVNAMTVFEFEIFCRDFEICPKYLTRDEVNLIFKNMSFEKIQRGDKPMSYMTLDDFKDSLIRLALSMYNKPGLKRLIKAACGAEPNAIEKVTYFCHQIHLDDLTAVRSIISTKGKKMQGQVNYPAVQKENSSRAKDIIEEEIRGKKIINKIKEEYNIARRRQGGKHTAHEEMMLDTLEYRQGPSKHINTTNNNSYQSVVSKSLGSQRGSSTGGASTESPSRPNIVSGLGLGSGVHPHSPSLIPENISKMLMARPEVKDDKDDISVMSAEGAEDKDNKRKNSGGGGGGGGGGAYAKSGNLDFPQSDDRSTDHSYMSAMSKNTADLTEEYIKDMLDGYDRDLKSIIERYCFDSTRPSATSAIIQTGLPAVDLGLVSRGVDCFVYFQLTNKTKYDIHFDVTCHDLQCSNANVETKPAVIVPGFSRNIIVNFSVEGGFRSVIGSVDMHISVHQSGQRFRFRCPIFYKVSPLFDVHKIDHVRRLDSFSYNSLLSEHKLESKSLGLDFSSKPEKWNRTIKDNKKRTQEGGRGTV